MRLRESASRDVAGDLWLVILEEALEHQQEVEHSTTAVLLAKTSDSSSPEVFFKFQLDGIPEFRILKSGNRSSNQNT